MSKKTGKPKRKSSPTRPDSEVNQAPDGLDRIDRPLTLIAQVEQTLRRAIQDGVFPGDRLPTAVELAEQLGVSRETVRLALETLQVEGVLVKHRRRGTFINPPKVPTQLKTTSRTVGYLQADFSNQRGESETITQSISGYMLEGAISLASEARYHVLARNARTTGLNEAMFDLLSQGKIRGVIFASIAEEKILKRLTGMDIPAVLLDHELHLPKFSSVRPDTFSGTKQAVGYLASLGHQRIALAQWHQQDLNPWQQRGYRQGMQEAGLRCRRAWELSVAINREGAAEVVRTLLSMSPMPTAVICFNNFLASLVVEEGEKCDLLVPEDLSVFGGGGGEVIGLSCVQLDWHAMGRKAMDLLMNAIDTGDAHKPSHVIVPYELRQGKTTGPAK
ncbi:GntR family transcriptional regulator [bacterium]|nr:GntR family transcriptional regulator [bacterium]